MIDNWNETFKLAKNYYFEYGNLLIPTDYMINNRINLGRWICTQRNNYKKNKLSRDKVEKLEKIGMIWNPFDIQWDDFYKEAKKYFEKNGDLLIPAKYVTKDKKSLGRWIGTQRNNYKKNKLSRDKVEKLEKIGMVWNPFDLQWYSFYNLAIKYYKKNKNLSIPLDYKTMDDVNLGSWIGKQRKDYKDNKLSKEKIELLEKIDMIWNPFDSQWYDFYNSLVSYYKENGNSNVPLRYITKEGKKLGYWVGTQRRYYKDNTLSKEKIKLLEKVEIVWNPASMIWNETYKIAKTYFDENGNLNIPNIYFYKNINLGSWIITQRNNYNQKLLNDRQIKLLNKIGMEWDPIRSREYIWEHNYNIVLEFYKKYKHLYIPTNYISSDGTNIGMWLFEQRTKYSNNTLGENRKCKLDLLDKSWLEPANTKSSFPEYAVLYYINKYFPIASKLKNKKISEIDIYIPELKVGIEYDGPTHTKSVKKDKEKSLICQEMGIELIRIRDAQCPILDDESHKIILKNDSFEALDDGITELLKYLKITDFDVNIKRDYFEISDNYIKSIDLNWYIMYEKLEEYKKEYGNINVPINYKTADGLMLGHWISNIRNSVRNPNSQNIRINSNKIKLLNKLGMTWNPFETQWDDMYKLAIDYYRVHGNLLIPDKYVSNGNIKLGRWIGTQRNYYKNGSLSNEKIELLEKIDMIWDVHEHQWMNMYKLASNYYREYGNLLIPDKYVTSEGVHLGSWIGKQRRQYKNNVLSDIEIELLNKICMVWEPRKIK